MKNSDPLHVVAAIIVSGNQVLACRRASHKPSGGLWEFPGGKVNVGESSHEALSREILEELSLELEIVRAFDLSDTQVVDQVIRLETLLCFPKHSFSGVSTDHDAFKWLKCEDLGSLDWAKPDLPAVQKLRHFGVGL